MACDYGEIMLLVQKYLETHTFGDLILDHGVYASVSKSGHKFSLNYDMIEAKETDPLAQECRGLILAPLDCKPLYCEVTSDGKRHYENVGPGETFILAYPMKRFFNMGQGCAAELNFSDPNLSVLEKLDGTLCIVYFDFFTHKWCVATRSVSEADLLMDNGIYTFRTLFEKAVQDTCRLSFDELTVHLDFHHTYCFELTTPLNRVVVNYTNNRITLLAVRDILSLQEINLFDNKLNNLFALGIPMPLVYHYSTIADLVNWVSSLNPMQMEGTVVVDSNFNRIKIKNAAYVAASKIRDSLATSPRNCLELILLGKDDDAASFLPQEIQANLVSLKEKFVFWLKGQEELAQMIIEEARSIAPDKKTFALTVQKYKPSVPAALFNIYDGKANSIKDFIENNRKNGTWGDSFLDKLLEMSKKFVA
jgi:hypothetical protein